MMYCMKKFFHALQNEMFCFKSMGNSISMLIWMKREQLLLIYLSMLYGPRLEFVRKAEAVNARKHYTLHGYMIGIPNFLFIFGSLFY